MSNRQTISTSLPLRQTECQHTRYGSSGGGSLLIPIIMAKLPPEIRVHVARNTTEDVWDIESILNVIQNEIEAREIGEKINAISNNTEPKQPQLPKIPTTGSFLLDSTPPLPTPTCVYCSEMHFSASCPKITDMCSRKRDKDVLHAWEKSTIQNNATKVAESATENIISRFARNKPSTRPVTQVSRPTPHQESKTIRPSTTATTTSENANPKHRVLLQTATAIATNDEGTKLTTIRLLFDNGSQRSYITDSLRSRLQLKSLKTEKLNLNTFGESKFKKQSCDVVNLQLRKSEHDDPITISALTFPVICSPLPAKACTSYAHLDGLELADELCSSGSSTDLLIGSDYYWNFVTGETKRGEEGPIAVNSKLGWLLSGPLNETVDRS